MPFLSTRNSVIYNIIIILSIVISTVLSIVRSKHYRQYYQPYYQSNSNNDVYDNTGMFFDDMFILGEITTPHFMSKLFFCSISPSKRTKVKFLIILFDKIVISSVSGIWIKHKYMRLEHN